MMNRLGFPCRCDACRDIPEIEAQLDEAVRTGEVCLSPAVPEHPHFKVRSYCCPNCLKADKVGFLLRAPHA